MEDQKTELVNELVFLRERLEELWEQHPDNPNQRDIRFEYNEVEQRILETEREIVRLESIEREIDQE